MINESAELYMVRGKSGKYRRGKVLRMDDDMAQQYRKWGYDVWSVQGVFDTEEAAAEYNARQTNRYSSSREAWGTICSELAHNRNRLRDKSQPVISYDDILDVQLALAKRGI